MCVYTSVYECKFDTVWILTGFLIIIIIATFMTT